MRRQAERGSARLGRRGLGASEARRVRSSRALDGPPDANNHRRRPRRRHDGEVPRPRVAAHLPRDPLRRGAAPAARGQDRRHRARARTRTRERSPQMSSALERTDPEVFAAIQRETERQEYNLELIASENVVSEAVLEAQGPILPNKYAEGYPGRRYYGGCQFVDEVETL